MIVVRCSTTVPEQAELIRESFEPYGGLSIKDARRGTIEIYCFLNESFRFLLPKEDKIPEWISRKSDCFLAFLAGYSDAEGSFYLRKPYGNAKTPWAIFEIQSYDKGIIRNLWKGLKKLNVICPKPRISKPAGYTSKSGVKNKKDSWRITVARKDALWKLIKLLAPYIKHQNRRKQMKKVEENLILRNKLPYCRPINLSD